MNGGEGTKSENEIIKWLEADRERSEKRYFRQWGFNLCMVGLGIVSLTLALRTAVDLTEIQTVQLLGLSVMAFALGGLFIVVSPWIKVPKKG